MTQITTPANANNELLLSIVVFKDTTKTRKEIRVLGWTPVSFMFVFFVWSSLFPHLRDQATYFRPLQEESPIHPVLVQHVAETAAFERYLEKQIQHEVSFWWPREHDNKSHDSYDRYSHHSATRRNECMSLHGRMNTETVVATVAAGRH